MRIAGMIIMEDDICIGVDRISDKLIFVMNA